MSFTSDWIKVRFDGIAQNITDRIDKPSESGLNYYIGLDHLDTDQIRIKRFGSTSDVNATKFLCKKGDIIFGKRNAYLRKVAVCDRDAVVSAHSMTIRPKGKLIEPRFLPCLMQSSTFWKAAHAISEGSMSPTIKWKTLAKQEFIIPPLEEQQKIANLLWALEDNIEKTENLIAINEKLKKGLLNELLTKGIGHTKFKKTEIGEIPEEWEFNNLEEYTEKITKGTTPTTYGKNFVEKGINFIKVESIDESGNFIKNKFDYIDEDTHQFLKRSIIQENDVLFSIAGALGRTAIASKEILPANTNQAVAIVRVKDSNKISYEYLRYFLSSNLVEGFINRVQVKTAQANISLGVLSRLPVTVPPIKEQKEIVSIAKKIDSSIFCYIKHNIKLNDLKKKLTDDILKGEVKV